MAEQYDEIRRKITYLEKQLSETEKNYKQNLRLIEEEYKKRQQDAKLRIENLIENKKKQELSEFSRQLNLLRMEQEKIISHYIEAQKQAELVRQQERENELSKIKGEKDKLEEIIKTYKEENKKRGERQQDYAESMMHQLTDAKHDANSTPHALFCPKQFETIEQRDNELNEFRQKEMYEAVIGLASVLITDFELLKVTTEQRANEWNILYTRFSQLFQIISHDVNEFEQTPFHTPFMESVLLSEQEKNYWSRGEYKWMKEYLSNTGNLLSEIATSGVEQYLLSPKAYGLAEISDSYYDLKREKNHIYAIMNCIESERYYSDQRYLWGEYIINALEDVGYSLIQTFWEEADGGMLNKEWYNESHLQEMEHYENQSGYYMVEMGLGMKDKLEIKIYPVRENGICSRNECGILLNMATSGNQKSKDTILLVNKQRIESLIQSKVMIYGNPEDSVKREKEARKTVSVQEQEKYLNIAENGGI